MAMKYFGTDGIRGLYGQWPVVEGFAERLGRSLVRLLRKRGAGGNILIGMDTRGSGPALADALKTGILTEGGKVGLVGVVPTPGVAFGVKAIGYELGVVISASHNPWEYNGFKVFNGKGMKFSEQEEEEIETIIEGLIPKAPFPAKAHWVAEELEGPYTDFLCSACEDKAGVKGLRVLIDCANGATSRYANGVFGTLAGNVKVFFAEPNGKNVNNECGSEHPHVLAGYLKGSGADLAFCFDGDGDRIVAIDEKGQVLSGDHLIYIYALYLQSKGRLRSGLVVTTVMSNTGLKVALKDMGIEVHETNVGDRNVLYKMKELGAVLGGEESGHIIFLDKHTTGDGLLSAIRLMDALAYFQRPLSSLAGRLKLFPKRVRNLRVNEKIPLDEIPGLGPTIEQYKKALKGLGKVVVRYSGTEPVIRIMVEAEKEEVAERALDEISEKLMPYALP